MKVQAQFEREAAHAVDLIANRMDHYKDALVSSVATIEALGGKVSYPFWEKYVPKVNLTKEYPGINGLGVILEVQPDKVSHFILNQRKLRPQFDIHPKHLRNHYLPITYILPIKGNEKAIGLDIAYENNRYHAAIKAKKTGKTQITGPITLVQDKQKTAGFLLYVPFYKKQPGMKKHFIGMVYAPFIMTKLMKGLLLQKSKHVSLKISDGDEILYNEHTTQNINYVQNSAFITNKKLPMFGRTWSVNIQGSPLFQTATSQNQPLTILITGITIDALLLFLFISMSNTKRKAIAYANIKTKELKEKTILLENSSRYKSEFLANMSHELRTPLNSILLLSKLLLDEAKEGSSEQKSLQYINKGGQNLLVLINDILDLAKIESGKMIFRKDPIDLKQMVISMAEEFEIPCSEKKIEFRTQVDEKIAYVLMSDATRVNQILRNLLSNALKFTESGSIGLSVQITQERTTDSNSLMSKKHTLSFIIQDTGIGISEKDIEIIFSSFQQSDGQDNRKFGGIAV